MTALHLLPVVLGPVPTCGRTVCGHCSNEFTVNLSESSNPPPSRRAISRVNGTPGGQRYQSAMATLPITFDFTSLPCSRWAKHDGYSCWRFRLRQGPVQEFTFNIFLSGGWGYSAFRGRVRRPPFAPTPPNILGGFATPSSTQGSSFAVNNFPRTVIGFSFRAAVMETTPPLGGPKPFPRAVENT